jgi:hypothetical protein
VCWTQKRSINQRHKKPKRTGDPNQREGNAEKARAACLWGYIQCILS